MVRWLIFGVIGYILYKLVSNEHRKRTGQQQQQPEEPTARPVEQGKNMVKDPVCGAYVDSVSSVSIRDGDTVYRFCGYECRDKFLHNIRENKSIPESDK